MKYSASAFLLTGETEDVSGGRIGFRYFGRSPELGPIEILITDVPGLMFGRDLEGGDDLPEYEKGDTVLKKFYRE